MPSGAYYYFDSPNCLVKTAPYAAVGAAQWCPDCPAGYIHYNVNQWNQLFPGYSVPVPTHCRIPNQPSPPPANPNPGGSVPTVPPTPPAEGEDIPQPDGPITGPSPVPPKEGCGDAMATVDTDGRNSRFTGSGGSGTDFGYGPLDQLAQPLTVGLTPLATYSDDAPQYTQPLSVRIEPEWDGDDYAVHKYHEGTGDGILCIHPPELQDYHLHGSQTDFAGDPLNGDSRWPSDLSDVTLLLHNSDRSDFDGVTGDDSTTYLGFGTPLKDTVKPGYGWYLHGDPVTGYLIARPTTITGADDTTERRIILDGVVEARADAKVPAAANPNTGDYAPTTLWGRLSDSAPMWGSDQMAITKADNTLRVTTGTTTLDNASENVIFCDTDGGAVTVQLPSSPGEGSWFRIINSGSSGNNVTIDAQGKNIEGSASNGTLGDGDVMVLHYNATEGWW